MNRVIQVCASGVIALTVAASAQAAEQSKGQPQAVEQIAELKVSYSIISDEAMSNIKRSVEVVLDERVDQAILEKLAHQINDAANENFERTFIGWRIKGEDSGAYWARTDFTPSLTVSLLGAKAEEHKALKASGQTTNVDGEVLGTWMSTWAIESKMVGYRKDGKVFISSTYTDGSSSTKEYVEKLINGKIALEDAEGSDFGEYFVVNTQGGLEFWGPEEGNYYTAKPF